MQGQAPPPLQLQGYAMLFRMPWQRVEVLQQSSHPTPCTCASGARGGRAEFSWENVKSDRDREFYLGHSVKASVGRWQKGVLGS